MSKSIIRKYGDQIHEFFNKRKEENKIDE